MLLNAGFPIYLIFISWLPRLSALTDEPSVEVNFDGSSYISYKLASTKRTRQDYIKLLFRTIKPSGLLLHAGGKNGDFLTLELMRGKLRYSSNLGTVGNRSGFHEIFVGDHLADNEWHQVDVNRHGKNILIMLDITRKTSIAKGRYATLELDGNVYIAGLDRAAATRAQLLHHRYAPFANFEGCLEDVTLNRENFARLAKREVSNITIHGNISYGCPRSNYKPITFKHPQSHIKVSTSPYRDSLSFGFKFRTYETEGLLVTHKVTSLQGANIVLWLINNRLKLEVDFPHPHKQYTLHAGNALNDGLWHSVSVFVSGSAARLEVDGEEQHHRIRPKHRFINNLQIIIGGARSDPVGFVGCMYDIVAQGREVNVSRELSSRILFNQCSPNDRCLPNPCFNGGYCSQRLNDSKCDCSHTNFRGKRCQIPAYTGKESCEDWKAIGWDNDGYYMISPNNIKPFPIYCKMRNVKKPIAIISHIYTGKQVRAYRVGSRKSGFYFHPVKYSIDLQSIRALITKSTHCRQHLRYNCLNSLLFDSPHDFELEQGRGARWMSRDGKTMDYWAGATPGSKKCACGLTGECVRHDLMCNCDAWDGVWRQDEGYITDSNALPVTNIKFSVRGISKGKTNPSNYTLGDLECFGKKVPPTTLSTTSTREVTPTSSVLIGGENTHKDGGLGTTAATETTKSTLIGKASAKQTSKPTYGPPYDNPPRIVIIESQGKYITIRQNDNQALILIILSVILAVFIIAIVILMIKQNLFLPCKCIDGPAYRDVNHVDSVELGPPSSHFTNIDTEIVEYEASPYPARGMDGVLINTSSRDETAQSCQVIHVNILESISLDDTDRLHLSNCSSLSSPDIDDKEDCNKNKCDSPEYENIECLEMVLMKSPQEMIEVEVEKLKEALYEVISNSEVNINNNPVTKETTDDVIYSSIHEDFNRTLTISSSGLQFSRPPSYQDIEGACSSDSTHPHSSLSSATSSWDENSDYENMDSPLVLDVQTLDRRNSNSSTFNNCTVAVISIDKDDRLVNSDHYVNMYEPQDTINRTFRPDENSIHSHDFVNDTRENEPLLTKTPTTNQNNLRNEPMASHGDCDVDGDVRDDLLEQSDNETNSSHDDSDFRSSDSETSKEQPSAEAVPPDAPDWIRTQTFRPIKT